MTIRTTEVNFFGRPSGSENLAFPKGSKDPLIFQGPSEPPIVTTQFETNDVDFLKMWTLWAILELSKGTSGSPNILF